MIEILSQSENDALAVVVSGQLTSDDYDKLRPELELRAEQGHFNLLVELNDISGLEPSAIKDDLMFTKEFKDSIDKMAVVTDDQLLAKVSDFVGTPMGELLGVELKRFDERDVAWAWIGGMDAA
ncbi:MAG: STAS/SEC14 domain-containing protein [Acidimicrobiales bacterium]